MGTLAPGANPDFQRRYAADIAPGGVATSRTAVALDDRPARRRPADQPAWRAGDLALDGQFHELASTAGERDPTVLTRAVQMANDIDGAVQQLQAASADWDEPLTDIERRLRGLIWAGVDKVSEAPPVLREMASRPSTIEQLPAELEMATDQQAFGAALHDAAIGIATEHPEQLPVEVLPRGAALTRVQLFLRLAKDLATTADESGQMIRILASESPASRTIRALAQRELVAPPGEPTVEVPTEAAEKMPTWEKGLIGAGVSLAGTVGFGIGRTATSGTARTILTVATLLSSLGLVGSLAIAGITGTRATIDYVREQVSG